MPDAFVAIVILVFGVMMLVKGSFEAFPTEEQIEKARIGGACFVMVGAVIEIAISYGFYRNNRKGKSR